MEKQDQQIDTSLGKPTRVDKGQSEKGEPTREHRNVSTAEPMTDEEMSENLGGSEASAETPKPTAD